MLKVFLIGFLCVALTQASIGDSVKGGLGKAKDQASSLTGQQRSLRSVTDDLSKKAEDAKNSAQDQAGLRKKRQFEMIGGLMSE